MRVRVACRPLAGVAAALLACGAQFPSRAAPHDADSRSAITVASSEDPADGKTDDGAVTLRGAIKLANATPGPDTIVFESHGLKEFVIALTSPLPAVTDAVVIDAYEGLVNPLEPTVEIDGSAIRGACDGLEIAAGSSVVRGLAVTNFTGYGHVLRGGDTVVVGCNVGVGGHGRTPGGNGLGGVLVASSRNQIGAASDLPPFLGNTIAYNGSHGVEIAGGSRNTIAANVLGPENAGCGVLVASGGGNVVGGFRKGEGNVIASNGDAGVRVLTGEGNTIALNSVFSNSGLPIDLGPAGPTPNDPGDADKGANLLQNTPILKTARSGAAGAVVEGVLESAPNAVYRLEFFDERHFVQTVDVATEPSGASRFRVVLLEVVPGHLVVATATDPAGNTSEMSRPVRVRAAP